MIWGLALQPGHEYTETFEEETHLSMATLECRPGKFSVHQPSSHILVRTLQGEYLLCFLEKGTTPQQSLDLVLQPQEEVTFCVEGTATIFITGYTTTLCSDWDDRHSQDVQQSETLDEEPYYQDSNEIVVKAENEDTSEEGEEVDARDLGEAIIPTGKSDNEVEKEAQDFGLTSSRFDLNAQPMSSDVISECSEEKETKSEGFYEEVNQFTDIKPPRVEITSSSRFLPGDVSMAQSSDSEMLMCHICSKTFLSLETRQQHALNAHRDTTVDQDAESHGELTSKAQTCSSTPDCNAVCQPGTSQNVRRDVDPSRKCRVQYSWNSNKGAVFRYPDGTSKVLFNKRKSHKCQYCHKIFDSLGNRKTHERIHTGERPFACRFCPKDFVRKSHCIIHERCHTGEKPFQCQFCDRAFADSSNYNVHLKKHTGETPYYCRICHKGFSRGYDCRVHERLHSGEKPFACSICKKTFVNQSHCRRHEQLHSKHLIF